MAAGDARQASIAAQRRKKKQPGVTGAQAEGGTFTPSGFVPNKPAVVMPPDQAPYRHGQAPRQRAVKAIETTGEVTVKDTGPSHSDAQRHAQTLATQRMLVAHGARIAVDGVWGPETERAYRAYLQHTASNAVTNERYDASRQVGFQEITPQTVHEAVLRQQEAERRFRAQHVARVEVAHPSGNHRSRSPFVEGQQPDGYEAVFVNPDGQEVQAGHRPEPGARIHQVPYYLSPKFSVDPTLASLAVAANPDNPLQGLQTISKMREANMGGAAGMILQDTLQGLVPTRVATKIANGQTPDFGDVGSDLLNGALWLTPGAVAPGLRAARAGVTALREEGASSAALAAIRQSLGASRTASEDALMLKRATAAAKAEQRAEGPVVSPIRDELANALAQAPNITPKQAKAILEANDVNARAVAHTLGNGTTPEQAYRLMWQGANFHDVSPTIHEVGAMLAQTGREPEIANVARTPDTFQENTAALDRAARNIPRNAALREAAPPHAKTPKALNALLTDLQRRAIEAADYRQWYARSAAGILQHVGGDAAEADKIAALIAVYSPRAEVYSKSTEWNNLDRALNAYDEFKQTGQISPKWSISSHLEGEGDWQTFRAQQIMDGNFEWQGLKTNRFYRNFLQHIDPEKYKALFGDEKFTTIDTWMRRAFGYPAIQKTEERTTLFGTEHVPVGKKQEPITPRMYDFMDRATKAVADSLGWTPEEAQAAIWTSIKAETEGTPLENAGFDFMDAFAHREARRARPLAPEQIALDTSITSDTPRKSVIDAAIDASRAPDGGFTLTAGLNPDTGRDGYAVAYGAFEYREPAPLTGKGLLDFRNEHLPLLRSDPSLRVGGWHNPDDGQVYLDVSRVFGNLDEALQFGREQGQLAIFDRNSFDVIPTGLTPEQADSIKSVLKEEGRLRAQAAKYDDLLDRAFAQLSGKPKKTLTAAERNDAENYLFDWANRHPDSTMAQAFFDLAHDAALGRSSRDPELLFQDDALVQQIADAHGKKIDRAKILDEHRGRDMEGLPKSRASNREAQDIAHQYMRDAGMAYTPPTTYERVDPARARRIAEWYDSAVDAPHDPAVRAAYDAMAQETLAQYRAIQRAGYRFEFYPEGVDPYPSGPSAAIDDLRANKHMYVFPTEAGFGSLSEAQQAHPLLASSGEKWGGKDVTHNDIFRAVHDFFGHYKEGVGFRADGEENAWRAHSAMYSTDARRAMTAETRGQNSWVNYGPHGEANRTADQAATVYADQKAVLAPDWVVNEGSGQPKVLFQEGDTFPSEWVDQAHGAANPPQKEVMNDARNWLADLQWRNMDEEQIHELPDDVVQKAIDRIYDGGMEQFIADGMYFEQRPDWLAQAAPKVKGAVERRATGTILHLFQGADASTALHELAHAVEPLMPESMRTALKAAALEHGAQNYDEFVARSMERYFHEGVAPTRGMKRMFRTLATAMHDIYDVADHIPGGALNADVREVFNTWFRREAKADPQWARALAINVAQQRGHVFQTEHPADPTLEAAAMMFDQAGYSVEDAAKMFNVEPKALQAHIDSGAHAAEQKRILSNADVGAGEAATEKDVEHYLGKWLLQTEGEPPSVPDILASAKKTQRAQQEARSVERSDRFKRAEAIMHDTSLDPIERHRLAKNELRGELPKVEFEGFTHLDEEALSAMLTRIQEHPYLMPGQRIRAVDSLLNAVEGKTPTPSEILTLEHIFGKATTKGLRALSEHPRREMLLDLLNIPRSLMSTLDLSAPFRQGLVAGARHPILFAKNFGPMIRAMKSEQYYADVEKMIHEDPMYPMMLDGGLALTDFESLLTREEAKFSNTAERFTGGKYSPVRASGRAYVTFLNKMRYDMFKYHIRAAVARDINVQDHEFLRSLSEVINSATGRGGGGEKFERAAASLNTFLFSPRLLKSRLNFLDIRGLYGGGWYGSLHPYARRQALLSFATLGAEVTAVLGMFKLAFPNAQIAVDPRNPDFGKIRFGNTRIDIAGGFQQEIRLAAQIATGIAISSTTGKKLSLTAGGFGDPTRLDMLLRFFEGKESPIASFVTDKLRNQDQVGNKFVLWKEALNRVTPLLAQDTYDLIKSGDWEKGLAGYGVGMWGFGIQTYGPRDPAKKPTDKLTSAAEKAGVPPPSKDILIAVDHKAHLDSIVQSNKGDRLAQLKDAIKYYKKITGKHDLDRALATAKRVPDMADTYMDIIRTVLVGPGLSAYEDAVKAASDAKGIK